MAGGKRLAVGTNKRDSIGRVTRLQVKENQGSRPSPPLPGGVKKRVEPQRHRGTEIASLCLAARIVGEIASTRPAKAGLEIESKGRSVFQRFGLSVPLCL